MCCVFYGYVVDCLFLLLFVFFFKQKTAYEMRISDWSSDVCSSDLVYGSHFAEDLQDARRFGWKVPDCEFDWSALRDNVLAEVSRLEGLYTETLGNNKVEIIRPPPPAPPPPPLPPPPPPPPTPPTLPPLPPPPPPPPPPHPPPPP